MRQFWNIDVLVAKMKTMAFREPHTDTFVSFFNFLKKTCFDFFYMHLYVEVWHVSSVPLETMDIQSPEARATGDCELPDMGAGDQTWARIFSSVLLLSKC